MRVCIKRHSFQLNIKEPFVWLSTRAVTRVVLPKSYSWKFKNRHIRHIHRKTPVLESIMSCQVLYNIFETLQKEWVLSVVLFSLPFWPILCLLLDWNYIEKHEIRWYRLNRQQGFSLWEHAPSHYLLKKILETLLKLNPLFYVCAPF